MPVVNLTDIRLIAISGLRGRLAVSCSCPARSTRIGLADCTGLLVFAVLVESISVARFGMAVLTLLCLLSAVIDDFSNLSLPDRPLRTVMLFLTWPRRFLVSPLLAEALSLCSRRPR